MSSGPVADPGHSRMTWAIHGWPGLSTDGLVSVTSLAMAGHSRLAWLLFKNQKTRFFAGL